MSEPAEHFAPELKLRELPERMVERNPEVVEEDGKPIVNPPDAHAARRCAGQEVLELAVVRLDSPPACVTLGGGLRIDGAVTDERECPHPLSSNGYHLLMETGPASASRGWGLFST